MHCYSYGFLILATGYRVFVSFHYGLCPMIIRVVYYLRGCAYILVAAISYFHNPIVKIKTLFKVAPTALINTPRWESYLH